ncbi:hypothetical protein IH982_00980 [Patescibacteria group bacterium]|nr:hypothetical protein [Patescibacteria group bacterium]
MAGFFIASDPNGGLIVYKDAERILRIVAEEETAYAIALVDGLTLNGISFPALGVGLPLRKGDMIGMPGGGQFTITQDGLPS